MNNRNPFGRIPSQEPPYTNDPRGRGASPPMPPPFDRAAFPPQMQPNYGAHLPMHPLDRRAHPMMPVPHLSPQPGPHAQAQSGFDMNPRIVPPPQHAMATVGAGMPMGSPLSMPQPRLPMPIARAGPAMPRPKLQSSFRPTGLRRALLIGVKYSGRSDRPGSIRDVTFMANLLTTRFGFNPQNLYVLTDAMHNIPCGSSGSPTRENMIKAMEWLVEDMRRGDSSVLYFTGKGDYQKDKNGDEKDGYDECIRPVDYKKEGHITDDEMYKILVENVSRGARLTAFMDCDYSGTSLDLPYQHDMQRLGTGKLVKPSHDSKLNKLKAIAGISKDPDDLGDVLLFSACRDKETVRIANAYDMGVVDSMTYALVLAVNSNRIITYRRLLNGTAENLRNAMIKEVPQFSSSHPFDLDNLFVI